MMEMVRGAVFDILQGQLGCGSRLPDAGRWLDLFAGTGAGSPGTPSRRCGHLLLSDDAPEKADTALCTFASICAT